tara:strand:- start:15 stop:1205 length:1191 start_codon:yes stop_codon:yes gene_type:complete
MKLPLSNFENWFEQNTSQPYYMSRYVEPQSICPDAGLRALSNLDTNSFPIFLAWIGIFISIEQSIHVITLFTQSYLSRVISVPLTFTTKIHPYTFPTGLALLWVFFTSLSHILVSLTWRSNVAVLTKGLHILIEALFFTQLILNFDYYFVSSATLTIVIIILFMILSLPCSATIEIASFSGIFLDSLNFLSLLFLGLTKNENIVIWTAIRAFGFHVVYLLTFIGIQKWHMNDELRSGFRLLGMASNIIASEIFIRLTHFLLYGRTTFYTTVKELKKNKKVVCIWTNDGLYIDSDDMIHNEKINVFDMYTTGYTLGNKKAILGIFQPFIGTCIISYHNHNTFRLRWSLLCAFHFTSFAKKNTLCQEDTVIKINWSFLRILYQIIATFVGSFIWYFLD